MKYWFNKEDPDECGSISYWKEYMKEEGIPELTIVRAKPDFGSGYFWCKAVDAVGEVSEGGCGKMCEHYKPRNGKSGRCKHSGYVYDQTDEMRVLKIKDWKMRYEIERVSKGIFEVVWYGWIGLRYTRSSMYQGTLVDCKRYIRDKEKEFHTDYSKKENQIGCGYCAKEKSCEIRDPKINKARLGCKEWVYFQDDVKV